MTPQPQSPSITSITDIPAPVETVWQVLTSFADYAAWHPGLTFVATPDIVDEGMTITAHLTSTGRDDAYDFVVTTFDPLRKLTWKGGIPGVLFGTHSFALVATSAGTRVTDQELFTGAQSAEALSRNHDAMERAATANGSALRTRALLLHNPPATKNGPEK